MESPETSEFEPTKDLEEFINQALELIKQGRYKEAIEYMRNLQLASQLGFVFDLAPTVVFLNRSPRPEELASLAYNVARHCHFQENKPTGKPLLTLSTVSQLPSHVLKEPVIIPDEIYHNISLAHAEEWLHGLQYLRNGPLTGVESDEIDVAIYLQQKEVPMTREFLDRYGRREALTKSTP